MRLMVQPQTEFDMVDLRSRDTVNECADKRRADFIGIIQQG